MDENRARVIISLPEKGLPKVEIDGLFKAQDVKKCHLQLKRACSENIRKRRKTALQIREKTRELEREKIIKAAEKLEKAARQEKKKKEVKKDEPRRASKIN